MNALRDIREQEQHSRSEITTHVKIYSSSKTVNFFEK